MEDSQHLHQGRLEQLDKQLWLLAIVVITVLSLGLVLFMAPTAFGEQSNTQEGLYPRYIFGFCVLILLFNAYLIQRQSALRKLRRTLREEKTRNVEIRFQAAEDLLAGLPHGDRFDDALAMEIRRASGTGSTLSIMGIRVDPTADHRDPEDQLTILGDSAKALVGKLRKEDGIFRLRDGTFALIFPGIDGEEAGGVRKRLEETLADISGVAMRFAHQVRLASFPKDSASMHELKEIALTQETVHLADTGTDG